MNSDSIFGTLPDGRMVKEVVLRGGGLTAHLLTYGATLRDLRLAGHAEPLVLGFETLAPYSDHPGYFGAIVGRCANRIGNAAFVLDGKEHALDRNNGANHLHGGSGGAAFRVWDIAAQTESSVTFALTCPDGEMGYPGKLDIRATYSVLEAGILDLKLTAQTDAPTLCNLAHHSYFNLGGADILSHQLRIAADHYLPVDDGLIPSGQIAATSGTPFDFRSAKRLGAACAMVGIDNNFCLSDTVTTLRPVAELATDHLVMQISTDQPGLQIYDAARMSVPVPGLAGKAYGAYAGLAMEPQLWPDAIHHPDWAQPILRPGETYRQHSQFAFKRRGAKT